MIVTAEDTTCQLGRAYSFDHFASVQKHPRGLGGTYRRGDQTPVSLSLSDRSTSDSNGSDHRPSSIAHGTVEGRYHAAIEKLAHKEILLRTLQDELGEKEEQLSRKEEELRRKDAQVASLEEKLVQMSLELATAKAFQDEFLLATRRNSSSSTSPTQRKPSIDRPPPLLVPTRDVETKFAARPLTRRDARSSRRTNEHSKSDSAIRRDERLAGGGSMRQQKSCELPSFPDVARMPRIDTELAVAAPARRKPSATRRDRRASFHSQSDSAIPKTIAFYPDRLDETSVISEHQPHEILHDMVRSAIASREENKAKLMTPSRDANKLGARTLSQDVNKLPPPALARGSSLDVNKLASSVRSIGEFLHSFAKSDAAAKKRAQDASGGGLLRFSAVQHEADKCTETKDGEDHRALTNDHLHLDGVVFHDQWESGNGGNKNEEWPEF